MRVYSNAFVHEETGDVLGYELAIEQRNDSIVDARLYVYEGAPNDDRIQMSGPISGNKVKMEGSWVEHLIEYPSKNEVVKTHFVGVDGTLYPSLFRGTVNIEGITKPEKVKLKRVDRIWLCKP